MTLREAVRAALEGRQKQAAHDLFPERPDAEAELSKVLSGHRRPPWELLDLALQCSSRRPVLTYVERTAGVECREARPTDEILAEIAEQLRALADDRDGLLDRLQDALERQGHAESSSKPKLRARPEDRYRRAG